MHCAIALLLAATCVLAPATEPPVVTSDEPFEVPGRSGDETVVRLRAFCLRRTAPWPPGGKGAQTALGEADPRVTGLFARFRRLRNHRRERAALLARLRTARELTVTDELYAWCRESAAARRVLEGQPAVLTGLDARRRLLEVLLSRALLKEATQIAVWARVEDRQPEQVLADQAARHTFDSSLAVGHAETLLLRDQLLALWARLLLDRPPADSSADNARALLAASDSPSGALQRAYLETWPVERLVSLAAQAPTPAGAAGWYRLAAATTWDASLAGLLAAVAAGTAEPAACAAALAVDGRQTVDRAYEELLSGRLGETDRLLAPRRTPAGSAEQRGLDALLAALAKLRAGDLAGGRTALLDALDAPSPTAAPATRRVLASALWRRIDDQTAFARHWAAAVAQKDRPQQAIGELRLALAILPGQPTARRQLAALLAGDGAVAEARQELEALLLDGPHDVATLLALADLCQRSGDAATARAYRERAHDEDADPA